MLTSSAITAAAPRRKANGLASMRADSEPEPITTREYGHPLLERPLDQASLARADQHVAGSLPPQVDSLFVPLGERTGRW